VALGRCPDCDRLVAIVPSGPATPKVVTLRGKPYLAQDPRAAAWFPVSHERPEGGLCPGSRKEIV
jgi:hypothetical protein